MAPRIKSRYAVMAALPFVVAMAPATGGTTYDFIVKSQSTQTGNKETVTMKGRGSFAGSSARIELLEMQGGGSEQFGGKGSYFLATDGGRKFFLVDPNQKAAIEWDLGAAMAGMAKAMNAIGSVVKMEMSDIQISAQELGAGPTVQGYSTNHVRMVQNYTVSAKMFGKTSKSRTETTIDYYFAPQLKALVNPFVQNANAFTASFDLFNNPQYKSQMAAAQSKINGVPVKTVTTTVTIDEKGKRETSVTTMEMTNFRNSDIPATAFAIPAGYQTMQMTQMMNSAAAGANASGSAGASGSAQGDGKSLGQEVAAEAKQGATDAAKETARQGARDATKEAAAAAGKKLKGIFKR